MKSLLFFFLLIAPLHAIVWRADLKAAPTKQKGEMKQVGKVFYSPFKVFGGSCLALGGKWVLTSRHGTDQWKPSFLTVEFPGLGKKRYKVEKVVFPKKGDIALMKLEKKVSGAKAVALFTGKATKGQRVWIGGFGVSGPMGSVKPGGKFHSGHNRVDGIRGGKISISLGKPEDKMTEKDEAILTLFDSGSPLFIEAKDGWQLAGVASTASNGRDPKYGDRGSYARTAGSVEWIKKVVGEK